MKTLYLIILLIYSCGNDKKDPEELSHNPTPPELDLTNAPQKLPDGPSYSRMINIARHLADSKVYRLHQRGFFGSGQKVAILDNGFANLDQARGKTLPPDLEVESYPKNDPAEDDHGTRMAELVYAMATGQQSYTPRIEGPDIVLYNTNGFTNFKHAVADVIARGVDVVLYAQVWQYGGNFDGRGFINRVVDQAVDSGVIWINAAGNFADTSYEDVIAIDANAQVRLPDTDNSLEFTVAKPNTPVKIVASWSDYSDSELASTSIDFDLSVFDSRERLLTSSELRQVSRDGLAATSKYPREIIIANFNPGKYRLKIELKSSPRIRDDLKMRVTIEGEGVKIKRSQRENSVMIPADNPGVITVGASDYEASSALVKDGTTSKPEVLSASHIQFADGFDVRSTSTAAALFTGMILPLLQRDRISSKEELLEALSREKELNLILAQPFRVDERMPRQTPLPAEDNSPPANSGGYYSPATPRPELDPPRPKPQNPLENDHDIAYPHREQDERQHEGSRNSSQNDPHHRLRRPRKLPPEYRRPEGPRPERPDRPEDLPPFRAVD